MPNTTVAAILLGSRRPSDLRRAALAALASLCRPVIVSAAVNTARRELAGLPVDVVVHSSVRSGLQSALRSAPHLDAAVFLRCDQPSVTAGSIRRLLEAFQRTRLPIAAAFYDRKLDLPALFARVLFPKIFASSGDCHLANLIQTYSPRVASVSMPELASEADLSSEYAGLRR